MGDPAATVRVEAPHPTVNRVVAGHFREGPQYSTWRSEGTSDYLLIHTLDGVGRCGDLQLGAGDSVLLRPGVRHDYGTAEGADGWEILFAHFHPRAEWMPLLDWPEPAAGIRVIQTSGEVHARVSAAFRRAVRSRSGALARSEAFAVNALEEALLWLDTQNPATKRTDDRVLAVTEHIGSHLGDPLSIDVLARLVHLSPSRLTHLFSQHLGISPQRYIERERMLRAQLMLQLTNRSVASIAAEVGFADPLYFSNRFRRFAGASPTGYRG